MTKASAAPSMMTPSRSRSVVAAAGSGGIGARGQSGGFGRGLEGKEDRGMARGEAPCVGENGKARPLPRVVAAAGQICGKRVAGPGQLRRRPPDRMRAHQGRGGLAERAGPNLLAKLG